MAQLLPIPEIDLWAEIRFWSYVIKSGPDECWNWTGGCTGNEERRRRPVFKIGLVNYIAARVAWKITYKQDPGELLVCHSCSPPTLNSRQLCVNPAHLWLGTYSENMADGAAKGEAPTKNRSKLMDHDVQQIRALHVMGVGPTEIGSTYNLTRQQIHRIVTRESHADVP